MKPAVQKVTPQLSISPEKVCYILVKARQFDAKDAVTDTDPASNPTDDAMIDVLEDRSDDATYDEVKSFVDALTEDEQVDLVALAWLGRDDATLADWADLRHEALRVHNDRTAGYLLGMPQLSDYLEEGLSQFGRSCEEFEVGRL